MMLLAPVRQSRVPSLTQHAGGWCRCREASFCLHHRMCLRSHGSSSRAELSCCQSANCNGIRREEGEKGLFLSESLASLKAEDKQARNNHGNQNKYPVV